MQNKSFRVSKLGLEKEEELEIKLPTFTGLYRKQGHFIKVSISVSSSTLKPLTLWTMINYRKLLERWECQTILHVCWKTCVMINSLNSMWKKNWSVQDREKSKRGLTAVTLFVFYKLSTSSEMPGWVNYKPESRWGGININKQICGWYHSNGRNWRGTKELQDKC